MARFIFSAVLVTALSRSAAGAPDFEVVIGATPSACQKDRSQRFEPAVLDAKTMRLSLVQSWLASYTCKQYLVPKHLLTKSIAIDGLRTPGEVERRLPEFIRGAGLSSGSYAVTRIRDTSDLAESAAAATVVEAELAELGIRCETVGHCAIPRRHFEAWLADTNRIAMSVRLVPAVKEGRPTGFKLFGIRPHSVLSEIGFENGDTLLAINGRPVNTPDDALAIYGEMRTVTSVVVRIERRGSPGTLELSVE